MRNILVVLTAALVIVIAGCDDDDGKEACEAFGQKCPAGDPAAASASCSADRINDASNGGEVEDCIQAAATCAAAVTCLGTLK